MPGAPALRLVRSDDPAAFERSAGSFLALREAENNLPLGLISGLKAGRTFGADPPYFAVVHAGSAVVGAAMRTPPFNLILAAGTAPDALRLLVADALSAMPDTPGLVGPKELVARGASIWCDRTGARAEVTMAQRIYRLAHVIPPRDTPGRARVASDADRDTVVPWFQAFVAEAMPGHDASRERAEATADHFLRTRGLWLWEDGAPVAMAGVSGRTPSGARVGAVYTPPDRRRRGYASALVAALSQAQLDGGARFCFLYTDLANPTSNKIYQDIGYEPVCDVDEYRFSTA
ncbi:MAG TPA: GNAT family N-acetyltransferase [Candidatus Limnocylindria bacterium]|nr:GNAT family N-acetyltransferase [Candidatus Limnocylindria bacterium]